MGMIRIVVVGDSHTDAIKRALARGRFVDPEIAVEAYRYSKAKNGKEIGDLSESAVCELAASLGKDDLVVSTIGGNQHQTFSLIQHPDRFDLLLPGESEGLPDESSTLIPYGQLFETLDRGIRNKDGARLKSLREAAGCEVVHLIPPPPKEDSEHIMRRHETDFAKSGIAEKGISSAVLRKKVWQTQVAALRSICSEFDVVLLDPPTGTLDERGYLGREYYADDATHGNTKYGERVLRQLIARVRARKKN